MARRKTHAEHVADIAAKNPNVEVLGKIINNATKVLCRCKTCHHEWEAIPNNLKSGHGCPECGKKKQGGRLSHDEQVVAIAKVNPDIEILGEIKGSLMKVLCRCKVCNHKWNTAPHNLKKGCGCPKCAGKMKLSHTEQVEAIKKVNPNIEILGKIIKNNEKVLCRCKICSHEWNVAPNSLKKGYGCPECWKIKSRLPHEELISAITKGSPDVEVLGKIINTRTKVLCRCKICQHKWEVEPHNLIKGRGCPRCAKYGFKRYDIGKLYIMVDDLNVPTMMKIGVSVNEDKRSKEVLKSARKAGVSIPALHVAKTWEGPTDLMQRIEGMMHENYAEWNIKFPAKFDGCTEFFYYTPETAEVFDIIGETIHEIVNANKAA